MNLSVQDAADQLGLSTRTIYRFLEEGRLTRYKLGGQTRVDSHELDGLFIAQ